MNESTELCENCHYWRVPQPPVGNGSGVVLEGRRECHRRAAVMYAIQPERAWPQTLASEWCGEWRAKEIA
jgi:hypothetical protein